MLCTLRGCNNRVSLCPLRGCNNRACAYALLEGVIIVRVPMPA